MSAIASLTALDALNAALEDLCEAASCSVPLTPGSPAFTAGLVAAFRAQARTAAESRKSYRITDAPRSAEEIHD